ncbi:Terrein cluster-specific transcription factor terR [Colletotrichum sp. SAR 10_70]|nr:Terrein cluster-specific transcription factor terR [Colletotrichum sp. SAR 10_71]KAI8182850.1 Terrein cluster-specific transcription factor terR [Colletotrichum sp. SAR 10_70]KAI8189392.1 Terrein cluster-specific transcription factor terR [Colletotrichum sp. SAR 10_65]KAI8232745.1 Terrein cluster-specific transcription factor terR [Colletotrichum sp. SAR 10_86]KAJ5007509.1 Terrein cluster-specific transcription factor terR [Colletotrichum sp. SAR 10_66]
MSLPRPLTADIVGPRLDILQQDGRNHGFQQGYYPGELSDGPDYQFPLPFAVSEASAANAPDSSDLHIDAIQEEQATPWGDSKPIERANSALSSAGSLDDDMEWAVDLGWITSEAGTPSQFLESSVTTVVDDLEKSTTYKAASQIVSPANTQHPTDIVLANDTKSESSAGVTAPLSPSSPGRPRISASSQSFYGLRDAVCRLLGNNQQDLARALSVSEDKTPNASRTANPVPAGESDSYDGSWWMLESDTALEAYIAAFSDYFYSFIPTANIEARLKEARLPDASHLAAIASECDIPSLVTENVAIAVMHVRELDLAQIDADDEESVLSSAYSRSTAIG